MQRLGRAAALVMVSALMTLVAPLGVPAADAAPRGCTIVGTAGADVLVGTPRRDVVCGLGGDDRLVGRGGRDELHGGSGDDVLVGGRGHDDLRGGGGDDVLIGGPGVDFLRGQGGHDVLRGGTREDYLHGGAGDDDLDGGREADWLIGGPGQDRCPPDDTDHQTCYVDRVAPTLVSLTASPTRLDVTHAARPVTLRVHLRDDFSVRSWTPYLFLYRADVPGTSTGTHELTLVSGTVRDGVWSTTVTIPRGFPAVSLNVDLHVLDRAGHALHPRFESVVEVVDADPDLDMPAVTALAPTPGTTVDTRASRTITARARITDAHTGVGPPPLVCLPRPHLPQLDYYARSCTYATLIAGTRRDGIWQAVLRAPSKQGFLSGPACLYVSVTDAARPWSASDRGHTCRAIAEPGGWPTSSYTVLAGLEEPFVIRGR